MAKNETGGELSTSGEVEMVVHPAPALAALIENARPSVELVDLKAHVTYSASEGMRVRVVGVARYGNDRTSTWIEENPDIDVERLAALETALTELVRHEGADIRMKAEAAAAEALIVARRKGEL